jgi:hypothetical protein
MIPLLHWAMTSSGPETMNMGADMTGKASWLRSALTSGCWGIECLL